MCVDAQLPRTGFKANFWRGLDGRHLRGLGSVEARSSRPRSPGEQCLPLPTPAALGSQEDREPRALRRHRPAPCSCGGGEKPGQSRRMRDFFCLVYLYAGQRRIEESARLEGYNLLNKAHLKKTQ